jgi:hypothetical protein
MRSPSMLAFTALLVFAACAKKEPPPPPPPPAAPPPAPVAFRVVSVDLGKAIGPDKRVTTPATTFGVRDTIYAVVSTEGASPGANLVARWTFGAGLLVKEDTLRITPTGPTSTEFHIAKARPWPAGKYQVEIKVDGAVAGSKEFEIH